MSYCVAQGTPLSYMTTWMGGVTLGPGYIQLSVFTVHLKLRILLCTILQYKIKFFNKVWIVGMLEEYLHSLYTKQGTGVRRKETGSEENQGTLLFISNNCIEVWLIFSVTLSSAAQQCYSVIHIKSIYFFALYFYFFSFFKLLLLFLL